MQTPVNKLRRLLEVIVLLFSFVAHASDAPFASRDRNNLAEEWEPALCDQANPEKVARELIERELAGGQLSVKSPCLNQDQFSYIWATHDPSNESPVEPSIVLEAGATVRILRIIPLESPDQFRTDFEIRTGDGKNTYRESMPFVMHQTAKSRRIRSCGTNLDVPSQVYIRRECLPKK